MTEREHFLSLPPLQRRFLKGHQCGWCDQRLDRGCGSMYGPPCSDEKIIDRRKRCIEQDYRPRQRATAAPMTTTHSENN